MLDCPSHSAWVLKVVTTPSSFYLNTFAPGTNGDFYGSSFSVICHISPDGETMPRPAVLSIDAHSFLISCFPILFSLRKLFDLAGNLSVGGYRDGAASQSLIGCLTIVLDPHNQSIIYFIDNVRIRNIADRLTSLYSSLSFLFLALVLCVWPTGVVSTIAGSGNSITVHGVGTAASFYWLHPMTMGPDWCLCIGDFHHVRRISISDGLYWSYETFSIFPWPCPVFLVLCVFEFSLSRFLSFCLEFILSLDTFR